MGRINAKVDVSNVGSVDDLSDAIDRGIRSGGRDIREEGTKQAKDKLRTENAVWKGHLIAGFEYEYSREGDTLVVEINNDQEHARPVEYGAEYGSRGPPVAPLIPWVADNLSGWSMPAGESTGLPSPADLSEDERTVADGEGNTVDVVSETSPGILQKAFWLQRHIKENGLDAVGYMKEAERWAEANGSRTVARAIDREVKRL